jgi:hypothetical protein
VRACRIEMYPEDQSNVFLENDLPRNGLDDGGIRLDEKQMRLNVHLLQVKLSENGPHPGMGQNWHGPFYGAEYAPQRLIEFGLMFLPDPWQHDIANQGIVKFFAVLN